MRRTLLAALTGALVAALALPAQAKVAGTASITGPGLPEPIELDGNDGAGYAVEAELFGGASGAGRPPTTNLGPRYDVRFVMEIPEGHPPVVQQPVVQHLYPYAEGGPVVYTPPGQEWIGGEDGTAPGGWFVSGPELMNMLTAAGLPETSPVAGAERPQARTAPEGPSASAVPWAVTALVTLLVAAAAINRRRARPMAVER